MVAIVMGVITPVDRAIDLRLPRLLFSSSSVVLH